jgi:hypothetical protein
MARLDDLNGDEDAETVTIIVNGRGVELDLAERSMAKLNKALEPFWIGTEARYTVTKGGSTKKQTREPQGVDPKVVRAWARENGIEVNPVGHVRAAIVEQYKAAQ